MDRLDPAPQLARQLDIGEEALVAADQPAGEERGIEDHGAPGLSRPIGRGAMIGRGARGGRPPASKSTAPGLSKNDPPDLTGWPEDFHSGYVFHAARQRGIPVKRIMAPREHGGVPEPWLSFAVGGRGYFYSQAILISNPDPADSSQAHHVNRQLAHVTVDKYATKRLLVELGVPVPSGERFAAGDVEKAEAMFMEMGRPVCVKPGRAEQGRSVYPWLCDRSAFLEAFHAAGRAYRELVVEEHVEGEQVRLFYVRPSVIGLRLDRPANVVADGKRSIAELVAAKNEERRRRASPGAFPVLLDREAHRYLSQQGLALDSRPAAGVRVFLRGTSNPGTGRITSIAARFLHSTSARRVFCGRLPDVHLVAVEMMMADPTRPPGSGSHWVLGSTGRRD
jgi:hypothetical protein